MLVVLLSLCFVCVDSSDLVVSFNNNVDEQMRKNLSVTYGIEYVRELVHNSNRSYLLYRTTNNSTLLFFDANVAFAELQTRKVRRPRKIFNDPLFSSQKWYFAKINLQNVWDMGYTGRGVVLSVLDDGVEHNHTDLVQNYDRLASWDVIDHDPDPFPLNDKHNENRHGTRCAGEIAAASNNSFCGVGVAYKSGIGGIRMLANTVTDQIEAEAFSHNSQYIDIYSSSWGPMDDGKTVEGPGTLARLALESGVRHGRRGLGSVYVWASGNGGKNNDDCNCDGYSNSVHTLTFSSVADDGSVPWYSERCAVVLASTPSSGGVLQKRVLTTDIGNSCTDNHTGTSASAPIAAGVLALALEANGDLSYRDLMHAVVFSANSLIFGESERWMKNGVGLMYNINFGFGMLDAKKLVESVVKGDFYSSSELLSCEVPFSFFVEDKKRRVFSAKIGDCKVRYLEHVQVRATILLKKGERKDLSLLLRSPKFTKSQILSKRKLDNNIVGFEDWTFSTVHMWGEPSKGVWKLYISNENAEIDKIGASLIVHGTDTPSFFMKNNNKQKNFTKKTTVPSLFTYLARLTKKFKK